MLLVVVQHVHFGQKPGDTNKMDFRLGSGDFYGIFRGGNLLALGFPWPKHFSQSICFCYRNLLVSPFVKWACVKLLQLFKFEHSFRPEPNECLD